MGLHQPGRPLLVSLTWLECTYKGLWVPGESSSVSIEKKSHLDYEKVGELPGEVEEEGHGQGPPEGKGQAERGGREVGGQERRRRVVLVAEQGQPRQLVDECADGVGSTAKNLHPQHRFEAGGCGDGGGSTAKAPTQSSAVFQNWGGEN